MRVRYDWAEVQRFYDEGNGRDACMERFGFTTIAWYKAIARGALRADLQRQRRFDWEAVQQFYDTGQTYRACRARFNFSAGAWAKAVRRGELVTRPLRWPLERVMKNPKSRTTVKRTLLREG